MKREEHLAFCKKCMNREMDLKQGLICSITKSKANFIDHCNNFEIDPSYEKKFDDTEELHINIAKDLIDDTALQILKDQQNYPLALLAGGLVGIIGAILWAVITVATEYQIGYMAIAIGAGVGISMKYSGKGIDQIFGISGAIISIISCLLGNFLCIIGFLANQEHLGYIDTILLFDYSYLQSIMKEAFSPMDLLFYGIASYEGYKFAFRGFTEKEISDLKKR